MNYKDFQEYLYYKHSEQNPEVLDDMLPDDYERWLEEIGVEGIIEYGTRYGKKCAAQQLGKLGGQATLEKYGKKQLKEWGKKGGRPKSK